MALQFKIFVTIGLVSLFKTANSGIIRTPFEPTTIAITPGDNIIFQLTIDPTHSDSYRIEYTTTRENGRTEHGRIKTNPKADTNLLVRGSFSYIDIDRRFQLTTFKSAVNGFRQHSTTDSPKISNKFTRNEDFSDDILFPVDNYDNFQDLEDIFNQKENSDDGKKSKTTTEVPTSTDSDIASTTYGISNRHDFPAAVVASLLGKK